MAKQTLGKFIDLRSMLRLFDLLYCLCTHVGFMYDNTAFLTTEPDYPFLVFDHYRSQYKIYYSAEVYDKDWHQQEDIVVPYLILGQRIGYIVTE